MAVVANVSVQKAFFNKKLTVFALALYVSSAFLPWMVESYDYGGRYWSPGRGSVLFWPFMALHKDNWFLFGDFWFNQQFGHFLGWYSVTPFFGLYLGWIPLSLCTVASTILGSSEWLKLRVRFRDWHALMGVLLPSSGLFLALYQRTMQNEMVYLSDIPAYSIRLSWGFWLAAISAVLLAVSLLSSPERAQLRRCHSFLKTVLKRPALLIIPLCLVGFLMLNELQTRTGVTKAMYVQPVVCRQEIPCDPKFWEGDFDRILAVANVFRARVRHNNPEYCYCGFEVPLVSYRLFATILHSMGYIAREPIFLHPC